MPHSPVPSCRLRAALLGIVIALAGCTPASVPQDPTVTPRPSSSPGTAVVSTVSPAPPIVNATPLQADGQRSLSPNPLISRGKAVVSSSDVGDPGAVVDGHYCARPAWRTQIFPTWVAIDIGTGPGQLLVDWNSGYTGDYQMDGTRPSYGLAGDYVIETSADSTDGRNGTWQTAVTVTGNLTRTRAHLIPFAGAAWLRMTITAPAAGTVDNLLGIDEIDVFDATGGTDDTIFFLGDSITAAAYRGCDTLQPSYAALVHAATSDYFPATIDGGIGGVNSAFGAEQIDTWLLRNPAFRVWAIGYGTNDAWQAVPPDVFERQLQRIIDRIVAAGKTPVLARIPSATKGPQDANIQALNSVIDRLTESNHLRPGPDLYGWFKQHPEQLGPDGVHPTDTGSIALNRLWFEALRPLYAH